MTIIVIAFAFAHRMAPVADAAGEAPAPIPAIQGPGPVSPYWRTRVDTYGVVTAVVPTGFYLQDLAGDGREETSDGIFVYTRERPTVEPADCVELQGAYVDEFYEKTELSRVKRIRMVEPCTGVLPGSIALPPPQAALPAVAAYEHLEGMRVALTGAAGTVQGPTRHYANGDVELSLTPKELAPYLEDGRVHQAAPEEMASLLYVSGALGAALPDASWGDEVAIGQGEAILDYNFGKYQLLLAPGTPVTHIPRPRLGESAQPAGDEEVTVCAFNLLGMGSGAAQYVDPHEYAVGLDRRARVIAQVLGGCTIVAIQEAGTPADAEALAARLRTEYALDYEATALPGPQSRSAEFPLTNGLLTRAGRVRVVAAADGQRCSAVDYGVVDLNVACAEGEYPLFDRPPLVVDLEVDLKVAGVRDTVLPLRIIANHWKSKGGDESVNALRRLAQAGQVVSLVQPLLDANPSAAAIVLGDLNDYYQSEPVVHLQRETRPPLVHTGGWLPELDRHTYIYNGGSQTLDHLLVTEGIAGDIAEVNVLHVNADFAMPAEADPASLRRVSDHDPLLVRIRPAAATWLGGNVGYGDIEVTAFDGSGRPLGSALTDRRGDFRIWNLSRGRVRLDFAAPDYLLLPGVSVTATLRAGPNPLTLPAPEHAAVAAGIAAARATVSLSAAGD